LALIEGFSPRVAAYRTLERALTAFERSGIDRQDITVTDDIGRAQTALDKERYVATTDLQRPSALSGIEMIAEARGDLLVGAQVVLAAIEAGKQSWLPIRTYRRRWGRSSRSSLTVAGWSTAASRGTSPDCSTS
jgi:predicted homoserine dehydrogenase-like protein